MYAQPLNHVQLYVIPWTVAPQTPLSMEFSRQEYWSRLPFSTPGDLSNPGIEHTFLASPALVGRLFTTSTTRCYKLVVRKVFVVTEHRVDVQTTSGLGR